MTMLPPSQLINLAASMGGVARVVVLDLDKPPAERRVRIEPMGDPWIKAHPTIGGVRLNSSPSFRGGKITAQTIPLTEWIVRQTRAAAIMQAESGGDTGARCYNVETPSGVKCKPKPATPSPRGTDRGVWQWNSKAWPMITDAAADDPNTATALAALVSDGWQSFGPWQKSRGLDPTSEPYKTIAAAMESMFGYVKDLGVFGLPGEAGVLDAAQSVYSGLGNVLGWAEALGRLLSNLISPAWWRRVGVGALGVALVVAAVLALVFSSETARGAVKAATVAA